MMKVCASKVSFAGISAIYYLDMGGMRPCSEILDAQAQATSLMARYNILVTPRPRKLMVVFPTSQHGSLSR